MWWIITDNFSLRDSEILQSRWVYCCMKLTHQPFGVCLHIRCFALSIGSRCHACISVSAMAFDWFSCFIINRWRRSTCCHTVRTLSDCFHPLSHCFAWIRLPVPRAVHSPSWDFPFLVDQTKSFRLQNTWYDFQSVLAANSRSDTQTSWGADTALGLESPCSTTQPGSGYGSATVGKRAHAILRMCASWNTHMA